MARNVTYGPGKGAIRRINIPTPNPALADWLLSRECEREIRRVTEQVFTIYQNTLPMSKKDPLVPGSGERNLRRGADWDVGIGGWGKNDRYFGWVYNDALSYRKVKNQPYPRFIEYGKPSKDIPGQYQLRRAAALVARRMVSGPTLPPGITRDVSGGAKGRLRIARGLPGGGQFIKMSGEGLV